MEIKTEEYSITYDVASASVTCQGSLFLSPEEYEPILQLLTKAAEDKKWSKTFTMDIRELQFLNSSGINTLIKFLTYVSETESLKFQLVIKGQKNNLFHDKLLRNFKCMIPTLGVELS